MTEQEYDYLHEALKKYVNFKDNKKSRDLTRLINNMIFSPSYVSKKLFDDEIYTLDFLSKTKEKIRKDSFVSGLAIVEFQLILWRIRNRLSSWSVFSSMFLMVILSLLSVGVAIFKDYLLNFLVIYGIAAAFGMTYFQMKLKLYSSALSEFETALNELSTEVGDV